MVYALRISKNTFCSFVLLGIFAASAGCGDGHKRNTHEPPDLSGLWRIDSDSLSVLCEKLSFDSYTSRCDHLLLLNEDTSCAYRGIDFDYEGKDQRTSTLDDMIEKYERNIYWYDFSPDGGNATLRPDVELSWYVLDKKQEVIIGPYPTNVTFLSDSNLSAHVNRWTHWRLVPRPEFSGNGRLSDDNYGVRCRWHLRLMNNFHRKIFFHVGVDEHGVYLWKPVIHHYDFVGPERIVFRREEYKR